MTSIKLALITGATSGIGLALAHLLADKGIPLLIHGRDAKKAEAVAKALRSKVAVSIVIADLSTAEGQQCVALAIQQRAPDLVINNAGFGLYGLACACSLAEQLKMLAVNNACVVRLSVECARMLQARSQKGTIVNVSSITAFLVAPRMAVYAASKAFVNQFSQSLDVEMRPFGIRVLTACPGMVATRFRQQAGGVPCGAWDPLVTTADKAAKQIWKQIVRGKNMHLFNRASAGIAFLVRYCLPTSLVASLFNRAIIRIKGTSDS